MVVNHPDNTTLKLYRVRMQPIATIPFTDLTSDDNAHAIVRAGDGLIALALTLRTNGDLEVVMPIETCNQLSAALADAASAATEMTD
jgi:hypothetical protein